MEGEQRRLYHLHADWDHTPAGYITDYILFVVAIICALLALATRRSLRSEVHRRALVVFTVGIMLMAFSFFFGGIAHQMLDSYPHGEMFGMTWSSRNSGWMVLWMFGVALGMPGFAVLASVPLACKANAGGFRWAQYILWGLGKIAGELELVVLFMERLDQSGVLTAFAGTATLLLAVLVSLVLAAMTAWREGVRHAIGECLFTLGFFVAVLAHIVILTKPAACLSHHDHADCPYSASFNHNAVFHCILIISQIILTLGVITAVRPQEAGGETAGPGDIEATTVGAS